MADEGGFRIAGAYVEVNLKDSTDADYQKLKAKLQGEQPVDVKTKLGDPDNIPSTREKTQTELDADPVKIPAKVDDKGVAASATAAGSEGGSLMATAIGLALIAGGPLVGAAVAGIGLAGMIALGAVLEKGTPQVQAGWNKLKTDAVTAAKGAATGMAAPLADALGKIDTLVSNETPRLESMFAAASKGVAPLTDGVDSLVSNALPGLDNAIEHSQPIAQGLATVLGDAGNVVSDLGNATAASSGEIKTDLDDLGTVINQVGQLLGSFLGITSNLAQGAIPVLSGELGTLTGTLHGVESILGPIGPEAGGLITTFTLASKASSLLGGAADKLSGSLGGSKLLGGINNLIQSSTGLAGGLGGLAKGLPGVGFAVVALSGLTGLLIAAQGRAADSAAAQAAGNNALTKALGGTQQATLGQINSAVIADAQANLHVASLKSLADGQATLSQTLQQAGISQDEFATAIENGGPQLDGVRGKLSQYVSASQAASNAGKDQSDVQIAAAANASYLGGQLNGLVGDFQKSTAAAQLHAAQLVALSGNAQGAASNTSQLAADMKTLSDGTTNATDRIKTLQDYLATLADNGLEKAQDYAASLYDTINQMADGFSKAGGHILTANGALDVTTKNGRNVLQSLEGARDNMVGYAQSMADAGEPMSVINAGLGTQKDQLLKSMEQMGLSKSAAQRLLDQYKLLPKDIETQIKANNAQGLAAASSFQAKVNALHGKNVPLTAVAETGSADQKIETLVEKYNGRTIVLHATVSTSFPAEISLGRATGGIDVPSAIGMASGGVAPLGGSIATVVPPNTPRLIGDNVSSPEAFIPLNGSQRSRDLVMAAAAHEGVATAGGGVTYSPNFYVTQQPNEDGSVLAARLAAETSWEMMHMVGG